MIDRRALVTGVSRRRGIGFAVTRRLLADGASVTAHSWAPHDADQPWGEDPVGPAGLLAELGAAAPGADRRLAHTGCDLAEPGAPADLVARAIERWGGLDTLVVNHAHSASGGLLAVTAAELDRSWAVNVRATVLLVQAFAERYTGTGGAGGRVVLFTSGQHRGPMPGELAYVATKGALHQLTLTLADELIDRGITVNAVNPGPTDTGWADPETHRRIARAMPGGRWNTAADVAAAVAMLLGADAATLTGQVIDAEGGFRRERMGPS